VLMGHIKNWAFANVLRTPFPDSETGHPFLLNYFPQQLQERFEPHFVKHPLRREIIATAAVNHLINTAGIRFISQLMSETGKDIGAVVQTALDVDRETNAAQERIEAGESAATPQEHYERLLRIESAIAEVTHDTLGGRQGDVKKAKGARAPREMRVPTP
jgi:NAD-specific glutamate dehydrogenase